MFLPQYLQKVSSGFTLLLQWGHITLPDSFLPQFEQNFDEFLFCVLHEAQTTIAEPQNILLVNYNNYIIIILLLQNL
jgi:hypothetical protein